MYTHRGKNNFLLLSYITAILRYEYEYGVLSFLAYNISGLPPFMTDATYVPFFLIYTHDLAKSRCQQVIHFLSLLYKKKKEIVLAYSKINLLQKICLVI